MAYVNNIVAADPIYQGAARTLSFTVYTEATTDAQIAAGLGACLDIAGYALRWRLRDRNGLQTTRITKATSGLGIVISGTYNADPAINTQRAVVSLTAADADLAPDTYDHGFWRTDSGSETPLCAGTAVVRVVP